MLMIKKLKRPLRKSGYPLASGETTEVRGLTITNTNKFTIYIDKWTPDHQLKKNQK